MDASLIVLERLLDDGAVFEQITLQEIAANRWAETGAGVSILVGEESRCSCGW
jgi:hypothetical protein